jgi:ketosteroid isomerase-like protein
MSQENVEIAARWYEDATSKAELLAGMPKTTALCHPEVEWTAPEDGTTYRGRDGVRQRLEEWLESFAEYRYEV